MAVRQVIHTSMQAHPADSRSPYAVSLPAPSTSLTTTNHLSLLPLLPYPPYHHSTLLTLPSSYHSSILPDPLNSLHLFLCSPLTTLLFYSSAPMSTEILLHLLCLLPSLLSSATPRSLSFVLFTSSLRALPLTTPLTFTSPRSLQLLSHLPLPQTRYHHHKPFPPSLTLTPHHLHPVPPSSCLPTTPHLLHDPYLAATLPPQPTLRMARYT